MFSVFSEKFYGQFGSRLNVAAVVVDIALCKLRHDEIHAAYGCQEEGSFAPAYPLSPRRVDGYGYRAGKVKHLPAGSKSTFPVSANQAVAEEAVVAVPSFAC